MTYNQQGQEVKGSQVNIGVMYGDIHQIGDSIKLGDRESSTTAMKRGATAIDRIVVESVSSVDELEKGIQFAERQLARSISTRIGYYASLTDAPTFSSDDQRRNPYKALVEYSLEDAPYFYGRAEAIQTMLEKMQRAKLTVLYSESGAGKTSLLRAGLASRLLASGHFPLYLRPMRQTPGQYIKRAFLPDYSAQPELARFRDDRMSLIGFLERVTYYLGGRSSTTGQQIEGGTLPN